MSAYHIDAESYDRFYHGCSTFLPVFDVHTDTYDALHERSPFAVDCICMVAARVRDGGGTPSISPFMVKPFVEMVLQVNPAKFMSGV